MEEAGEASATLAGYLCADVAGSAGVPGTLRTGLYCHVLPCQTAALVRDADIFAAILLHPGSFHRPGGLARISEGSSASLALARAIYSAAGLFPLPVAVKYWGVASSVPAHSRHIQLGKNRPHRATPQRSRARGATTWSISPRGKPKID